MTLSFVQTKAIRLGVGQLVQDITRSRALRNRGRPMSGAELDLDIARKAAMFDQERVVLAHKETTERLSGQRPLEAFSKTMQASLASRDAATGEFSIPIPNAGSFDYRPQDSSAFLANAALGIESVLRGDITSEQLFADIDRSVGAFRKDTGPATLSIQVNLAGQKPLVATNKFILTSCSEPSQEKFQIFQTYDLDFIYFFDRNPHIYTYGGVLFNAADPDQSNQGSTVPAAQKTFNWKNRFQTLYEKRLRGTRCVDNNAHAVLEYEGVRRTGYLLNCVMTEDAQNPMTIPFSFTFFILSETNAVTDELASTVGTDLSIPAQTARERFEQRLQTIRAIRGAPPPG